MVYWGYNPFTILLLTSWDIQVIHMVHTIEIFSYDSCRFSMAQAAKVTLRLLRMLIYCTLMFENDSSTIMDLNKALLGG